MSINPDQRHDLLDYSVNILVRAEVNQNDYWDVLYQGLEKVKVRFDMEGIHIPYPQQEIHITEKIKSGKILDFQLTNLTGLQNLSDLIYHLRR